MMVAERLGGFARLGKIQKPQKAMAVLGMQAGSDPAKCALCSPETPPVILAQPLLPHGTGSTFNQVTCIILSLAKPRHLSIHQIGLSRTRALPA